MATSAQQHGPTDTITSEETFKSDGAHNRIPSVSTASNSAAMQSAPGTKSAKKAKAKKGVDPNETGKLLAAKINQLEIDAAGEKDQEQEIGMSGSILAKGSARYLHAGACSCQANPLSIEQEATKAGSFTAYADLCSMLQNVKFVKRPATSTTFLLAWAPH